MASLNPFKLSEHDIKISLNSLEFKSLKIFNHFLADSDSNTQNLHIILP